MEDEWTENENDRLEIEKRTTNRELDEIKKGGYRDGRQKYAEDETLMQKGFDAGYKEFVKSAFLSEISKTSSTEIEAQTQLEKSQS